MENKTDPKEMEQNQTKKRTRKEYPMSKGLREIEKLPILDISLESGIHCLDWYDSDVSLTIDTETMMVGAPRGGRLWSYIWSGARSTYGFITGKVYYEVKILEELKYTQANDSSEIVSPLKEIRIGWSTNDSELVLGRNGGGSFAYSSRNGKKLREGKAEDYGQLYGPGDVIGCYLEFQADKITMLYTKNGENQGNAFAIPASHLNGKALFPHVSTKSLTFEVNFGFNVVSTKHELDASTSILFSRGERKKPWCNPLPSYTIAGNAKSEGNFPFIEKWEDCELLSLVGLPYCGKTTWANSNADANPSKRINVIGIAQLLDRTEVDGQLIHDYLDKHEKNKIPKFGSDARKMCVDEWFALALKRKRNVTVDKALYSYSSESRWLKAVEGTVKKAIVIVPSDNDYKSRVEKVKKSNNQYVGIRSVGTHINDKWIDNSISGAKGMFSLPPVDGSSPFNDVSYVELGKDQAAALIEIYQKEAKADEDLRKKKKKRAELLSIEIAENITRKKKAAEANKVQQIQRAGKELQMQQQLIIAAQQQELLLKQQQLMAVVQTQKQIMETMNQLKRPRTDYRSMASSSNYSTGPVQERNGNMNGNINALNGLDMRTAMQNIYSQGMLGNSTFDTSDLKNLLSKGNMGNQGMKRAKF